MLLQNPHLRGCARVCFVFYVWACGTVLSAQSNAQQKHENFIQRFERRASETQNKQPGWAIPLSAPHSGLIQSYRADFFRQISNTGVRTWNHGGGKGANFIPLPNTQIDINMPAYYNRSTGSGEGLGDFAFGVKYRIFTSNEKKHNYSGMLGVAFSFPTAHEKNGSSDPIITPNLAIGKGWGRFDLQTSSQIALPTGNVQTLGRHVTWNTVAQYKIGKIFWPEIENSTVFFRGGSNDGKIQNFILPGVMVGKIKFFPKDPKSRSGVAFGAGYQWATTPFHTFDHVPYFSVRVAF